MKKILCVMLISTAAMCFVACGNTTSGGSNAGSQSSEAYVNVNLDEVVQAVKDAYGDDYVPNMQYDEEYLSNTYGLTSDMYEEVIAEGPMISFNIDTLVAVKAQEGKGDEVYALLNAYKEDQINNSVQYPVNQVRIQASEVIQHGDYVFYTLLGTISMETEEQGDEAILKEAQEKNQIAIDTINSFFE